MATQEQIKKILTDARNAQKSTTAEGVLYTLDIPANIDNLRAVRAQLQALRAEGFATCRNARWMAK